MPSSRPGSDLSAALRHQLIAGYQPGPSTGGCRLVGWPAVAQLQAADLQAAWQQHRAALIAEADFVVWGAVHFDGATDSREAQTARRVWSHTFYERDGY